jgi:hypothetical protein
MFLYLKRCAKQVREENDYKILCQQLVTQWQGEKLQLNPGATEQELTDFETQNDLTLPDDFRYLYQLVNGLDWDPDKSFFCLWSLARIQEILDNTTPDQWRVVFPNEIPFGDYLIDSHRYCLVTKGDNQFCVKMEGITGEKLANNFTAFLIRYLSEPDKLYLW